MKHDCREQVQQRVNPAAVDRAPRRSNEAGGLCGLPCDKEGKGDEDRYLQATLQTGPGDHDACGRECDYSEYRQRERYLCHPNPKPMGTTGRCQFQFLKSVLERSPTGV